MKKKIREEIRLKTAQELEKLLRDSQDLLFKIMLDKVQNKLKNQRQIFTERKKIAFVLTLLNEKGKEKEIQDKVKSKKENEEVRKNAQS